MSGTLDPRAHRSTPLLRAGGRWATGLPVTGRWRTDADWVHRGEHPTTRSGRAWAWDYWPGWQRMGVRWAGALGMVGVGVAYNYQPMMTEVGMGGVVTCSCAALIVRARRRFMSRALRTQVASPLAVSLAPKLGCEPSAVAGLLRIPPTFETDPDTPLVITLPPQFDTTRAGRALVRTVLAKLPLTDPEIEWNTWGASPNLTIRARPPVPDFVSLDELLPFIRAATPDQLFVGRGLGGALVSTSTDDEAPHIGVAAETKKGKSKLVALLAAQKMFHGASVVFLDIRMESHLWATDLPNALVRISVESIYDALVAVGAEIQRRRQMVYRAHNERRPRPVFPELWVVAEEMNELRDAMSMLWGLMVAKEKRLPPDERELPPINPALVALKQIASGGRSTNVHVAAVAQKMHAHATGDNSGAFRDNLGTKLALSLEPKSWALIMAEKWRKEFKDEPRGRARMSTGGDTIPVQVAFGEDAEFAALAVAGTVGALPPGLLSEVGAWPNQPAVTSADDLGHPGQTPTSDSTPDTPADVWLTAKQAVDAGLWSGEPGSLNKAINRADARPLIRRSGRGLPNEYEEKTLRLWLADRAAHVDPELQNAAPPF